jgi:hypothetical protein
MQKLKKIIFFIERHLVEFGEKTGLHFLVYNPITWGRFFVSAQRNGRAFATACKSHFSDIHSILDFGAGVGGYVRALRSAGFSADGLEYSKVGRALSYLCGLKMFPWACGDRKCLSRLPHPRYDVAISIEVAEHLEPGLGQSLVDQMSASADLIIFSAAQPGQGGQGHLNEQPKENWEKLFFAKGFFLLGPLTRDFISSMEAKGFRGCALANLMIFKRQKKLF